MKISALLTLLPLASAASIPVRSTNNANTKFSVMSTRSASPIHMLPMNAVNGGFWLGESPTTYCPENVEELGGCAPGTVTRFASETALVRSHSHPQKLQSTY